MVNEIAAEKLEIIRENLMVLSEAQSIIVENVEPKVVNDTVLYHLRKFNEYTAILMGDNDGEE